MEEQNNLFSFDQQTPSFDINSAGNMDYFTGKDDNAFTRWWNPQIAENRAFQQENYYVDKANAFNEYMYNKALEDNSPVAQMERAKQAGINLNLAAGGIMGGGNAVASPLSAAQGSAHMNQNAANPIETIANGISSLNTGIEGAKGLGELLGFGKKNKAEIKQINAIADQAAEQADFTYWQKRQFRRTMNIMADKLYLDYDTAEQFLLNMKKEYEKIQQEIWNIAEDTNLKTAQTGETKKRAKNIAYQNAKEQIIMDFQKKFGILLNDSDYSMIAQLFLEGKGDVIIDALTKCLKSFGNGIKNSVKGPVKQWWENNEEIGNKLMDKIKGIWNKYIKADPNATKEQRREAYGKSWDNLSYSVKKDLEDQGITREQYIEILMEDDEQQTEK